MDIDNSNGEKLNLQANKLVSNDTNNDNGEVDPLTIVSERDFELMREALVEVVCVF
jgi:hypothetical protein